MIYLTHASCFILGALWCLWFLRGSRERTAAATLLALAEELRDSEIQIEAEAFIPVVAYGGPMDGIEFEAPVGSYHTFIEGYRYDFAARTTPDGKRWIYRHNPGQPLIAH